MDGRDLIAGVCTLQAHNGSGKTTCFTLAMLSRVDPNLPQPQAICVCPTRCSLTHKHILNQ
jgi:superfamily II DNA/RNA helicase